MRWLRRLFDKSRSENHLDKELRFHIEQQIADTIAAGVSLEEARRRANLEFGGLERVKEEVRDTLWDATSSPSPDPRPLWGLGGPEENSNNGNCADRKLSR